MLSGSARVDPMVANAWLADCFRNRSAKIIEILER